MYPFDAARNYPAPGAVHPNRVAGVVIAGLVVLVLSLDFLRGQEKLCDLAQEQLALNVEFRALQHHKRKKDDDWKTVQNDVNKLEQEFAKLQGDAFVRLKAEQQVLNNNKAQLDSQIKEWREHGKLLHESINHINRWRDKFFIYLYMVTPRMFEGGQGLKYIGNQVKVTAIGHAVKEANAQVTKEGYGAERQLKVGDSILFIISGGDNVMGTLKSNRNMEFAVVVQRKINKKDKTA